MNSDWVKRRGKSLNRIWHSLKTEEKELASKGIIISFENAKNEIQKLLDEIEKIKADE